MTAGRHALAAELQEIDEFLELIGAPHEARRVIGDVRPGISLYEPSPLTRLERIRWAIRKAATEDSSELLVRVESDRNYWKREAMRLRELLGERMGVNA